MPIDLSAVEGRDSVIGISEYASIEAYDQLLETLKNVLISYYRREPLLGNGIDEFIDIIMLWLLRNQKDPRILLLSPSYGRYTQAAARFGLLTATAARYTYRSNIFAPRPIEEIVQVIKDEKPTAFLFSNPGNPTPDFYSLHEIKFLLDRISSECLVIVDEAFVEYATVSDQETSLNLIDRYSNLVVLRTFSKAYGLFGLRIGLLFSSEDTIRSLRPMQRRYTLSQPSIVQFLTIYERKKLASYRKEISSRNASRIEYFRLNLPRLPYFSSAGIWLGSTNFCLCYSKDNPPDHIRIKNITEKFEAINRLVYRARIPDADEINSLLIA